MCKGAFEAEPTFEPRRLPHGTLGRADGAPLPSFALSGELAVEAQSLAVWSLRRFGGPAPQA